MNHTNAGRIFLYHAAVRRFPPPDEAPRHAGMPEPHPYSLLSAFCNACIVLYATRAHRIKERYNLAFRYNIRFSGASGQGLLQAARILAEAAAIYDDKNAAESCSYGPEARGSAARADIIVSDEDIHYPKVGSVDLLIALTREAYDRYIKDLKPTGIVVVDDRIETGSEVEGRTLFSVPFAEIAEKECKRPAMVNVVTLGFFAGVSDVVRESSIRQAVLSRAPKSSEAVYIEAYEAGLRAATGHVGRE